MADQADMIRKIQACLNLANDPNAQPAERELAQKRAEELMVKYEIDEAMMFVEHKGTTRAQDVVSTSFFIKATDDNFIPQQRMMLAASLANRMNCRAIIETKFATADVDTGAPIPGGEYLSIVGFRNDVENARQLYNLLVPDIALAVAREKQTTVNYVREFANGYVYEVDRRLAEMRRTVERQVEETKGMGLVLRDKAAAVLDKYNEMYPNQRQANMKTDSRYDPNARARGAKAGAAADLGQTKVGGGARKGIGS